VKSKWLVSAILASELPAPEFAQVAQGLASQPEISPVAAFPDAHRERRHLRRRFTRWQLQPYRRGVSSRR
jgi:hypothetical protein